MPSKNDIIIFPSSSKAVFTCYTIMTIHWMKMLKFLIFCMSYIFNFTYNYIKQVSLQFPNINRKFKIVFVDQVSNHEKIKIINSINIDNSQNTLKKLCHRYMSTENHNKHA